MKQLRALPLLAVLIVTAASCTLIPEGAARDLLPSSTPFRTAEAAFHVLIERHVDKPTSTLVLGGAIDGVTALLKKEGITDPVLAKSSLTNRTQSDFQKFSDALGAVVQRYPKEDKTKLEQAAVDGMARALNECHTYYIDPTRAKSFNQPPQPYSGIGTTVGKPDPNGPVEILGVIPGSPAERASLQVGDKIKTVAGEDVQTFTTEEVANRIRGPEGTPITIVFIRKGADFTLSINRARVTQPQVVSRTLDSGFGYVSIAALNGQVAQQTKEAVQRLFSQNVAGLVLDLRNDPGGDYPVAINVASIFIKDGVLVYNVGRDGKREEVRTVGSWFVGVRPLVVLVNRASASGAEIIAAGVRANGVGRVIGARTAGCVGTARVQAMPDGGTLLVGDSTMQDAKTGQDLHGPDKGVVPDEVVTNPDPATDLQLAAAISYLKQARGSN